MINMMGRNMLVASSLPKAMPAPYRSGAVFYPFPPLPLTGPVVASKSHRFSEQISEQRRPAPIPMSNNAFSRAD